MRAIARMALALVCLVALAGMARGGPKEPVVRVEGRGGVPVPDANVWVDDGSGWKRVGVTDATGTIALGNVSAGGTVRVAESGGYPEVSTGDLDEGAVAVQSTETVIHLPNAIRLAAEFVDARTGKAVTVPWTTNPGFRPLSVEPRVERTSIGRAPTADFKAPDGWAAEPGATYGDWASTAYREMSRTATDLRVVQPLRPQALIDVSIVGPDAKTRSAVLEWSWPGTDVWRTVVLAGNSVRGVPWYPSEPMDLRASPAADDPAGLDPSTVRVRLPATPTERVRARFVLPRGAGDRPLKDDPMGFEETFGEELLQPSSDTGRLSITMRALDGSPLREAAVYVRARNLTKNSETSGRVYLDERGRIELRSLRAGEYSVEAENAGVLPVRATVRVTSDAQAAVDLQEGPGGALLVSVVDSAGKSLPYAALDLTTSSGAEASSFDERNGVQRLDLFAGLDGRRRLERVEPGLLTVRATWGARRGEASVTVAERTTAEVTIVLPDSR